MENNNTHEIVKAIKQEFFVYRNGALVDALRRNNDCHKMILGLNIPQIQDIASRFDKNKAVAEELWANVGHRECRLAAPLLYPIEQFTQDDAKRWIESIENEEIADYLCLRLLRYAPFADSFIDENINDNTYILRYLSIRLLLNLIVLNKYSDTDKALSIAKSALSSSHKGIVDIANRIIENLQE